MHAVGESVDRDGQRSLGPDGVRDPFDRERHVDVVAVVVQRDDDLAVGDPARAFDTRLCVIDAGCLVTIETDRLREVDTVVRDGDGPWTVEHARDGDSLGWSLP